MLYFSKRIRIEGESWSANLSAQAEAEQQVHEVLGKISTAGVGRALLDNLDRGRHAVTIRQKRGRMPTAEVDLTGLTTARERLERVRASNVAGERLNGKEGRRLPSGACVPEKTHDVTGTGEGAPVEIRFDPLEDSPTSFGYFPDRVLLHELTHAHQKQLGRYQNHPTCDDFHLEEEFFAVLMENLYVSELRATRGLRHLKYRANHLERFVALPPEEARSRPYYARHKARIDHFRNVMPELAQAVATALLLVEGLGLEFNPLGLSVFGR